jgi:transposase
LQTASLASRSPARAAEVSSRSTLVIVWHLLTDPDARFADLGSGFYDTRVGPERKTRNHIRQLEALGYKATLEPAA